MNNKLSPTLKFLFNLEFFGIKLGLQNISELLEFWNNPQNEYPTIHIAGTNGKGTTAHAIAAVLQQEGYLVGLYTSPHLIRFNERIKINGIEISNNELEILTSDLKKEIIKIKATFFEATTAIAFKYFANKKVDIAIIETGLGGKLDATNIIKPICSVITSVGMDHKKELGNKIELIAKEKSGIIKNKKPVFTNSNNKNVLGILKQAAKINNSPFNKIASLNKSEEVNNLLLAKRTLKFVSENYFPIKKQNFVKGICNYKILTGLNGRFEVFSKSPTIILDVAHNPDAIKNLVLKLKRNYPTKNFILLFGVMKDKDYKTMFSTLLKLKPFIIAVTPNTKRALPAKIISNYFLQKNFKAIGCVKISTGIKLAKSLALKDEIIVVTGSHYVVGEFLKNYNNS